MPDGREYEISRMLSELPYLPSPIQAIDAALDLADIRSGDVFADLGCGDGYVLIRVAERFNVFSVGFELDPRLIGIALKKIKALGLSHIISLVQADFFQIDLLRFDVIYVYPSPMVIRPLSLKLANEASRRARILVLDNPLTGLEPSGLKDVYSEKGFHRVYLYTPYGKKDVLKLK
ncbi:MAG: SAM-dependent methyltransferase [Thermoproteota archaeon]